MSSKAAFEQTRRTIARARLQQRRAWLSHQERAFFSAARDAVFGTNNKNERKKNENGNANDEDDLKLLSRTFSSRKIVREVRPHELFDIVADVDKYSEFLPFCRKSRVTKRTCANAFEAELEIGFKIFNERYLSKVSLERPRKVVAEDASNALFEKMKTVWRFRELDETDDDDSRNRNNSNSNNSSNSANDNDDDDEKKEKKKTTNVSTVVDFEIQFKVRSSAHAAALSIFFEDVANTQIQAFEKRCRTLMIKNSS
jgi:coenzyme Q-binding protein COQ10